MIDFGHFEENPTLGQIFGHVYQGEFDSRKNKRRNCTICTISFRLDTWMARMAEGMVKGLGDLGLVTL